MEPIYIITRCWKRYEQAGWYQIFGAGGFWNTYLEDRRFGTDGHPPYVGQLLARVTLWPILEARLITQRAINIVSFSILEPTHPGVSHDDHEE